VQQAAAELELWRGNLGKIKLWLQDRVQVSALLLDSERFECSRPVPESCANETLLAAIDEKHNSITSEDVLIGTSEDVLIFNALPPVASLTATWPRSSLAGQGCFVLRPKAP
jgi:hypothetical protein